MLQWKRSAAAARLAGTLLAALAITVLTVGCESSCPCNKDCKSKSEKKAASNTCQPSGQLVAQTVYSPTPDDPPKPENKPAGDQDQPKAKDAAKASEKPKKLEDMDREALIELIKKRAAEYTGEPVPTPAKKPPAAAPAKKPIPATTKMPAPLVNQKPPAKRQGDKKPDEGKSAGCKGGSGAALTPPPPDQPQPQYICAEPVQKVENIWKGSKANFTFTFKNDGKAPLALRVRKG